MRRRTILASLGLALTGVAGCNGESAQPTAGPTEQSGGQSTPESGAGAGSTAEPTTATTAAPVDPSAFSLTEAWRWTPPESGQDRQTTGVTVGEGYLTLSRTGADSSVTTVLDGASGTERWRRQLDLGLPTVHGAERLYHGGDRERLGMTALDATDGAQAWQYSPEVDVPADGVGPTVQLRAGNAGVVAALDSGAARARPGRLVLVDPATGEVTWEITDIGDIFGLATRGSALLYTPTGGATRLVDLERETDVWRRDLPGSRRAALTRDLAVLPADRTPENRDGATIAVDRQSGEVVWRSTALSPRNTESFVVTDRAVVRATSSVGSVTIHGHSLDTGDQTWARTFETDDVEALAAPVRQFDQRALVVPLSDGRVVLCSLTTGETVAEMTVETAGSVDTDTERLYLVTGAGVRAFTP